MLSFPPVQPSGCPSAIAPPFTFTISGFSPNSFITATACDANASFNSICSMSSNFNPTYFSAIGTASTGPIPICFGSTPATE